MKIKTMEETKNKQIKDKSIEQQPFEEIPIQKFIVSREKVEKISSIMASQDGYERLLKMNKNDLKKMFSSQEFCYTMYSFAIEYQNGKRGKKYENFINNISKMLLDKDLAKTFFETYPSSIGQRWAMGILYNSEIGNKILKKTLLKLPTNMSALSEIIKGMTKPYPDKKLQELDRSLFRLPEQIIELSKKDKVVLNKLKLYLSGKTKMTEEELSNFLKNNKESLVRIIESKEGREEFVNALKNEKSRKQLLEMMKNKEARPILTEAISTAAGANTFGDLFAYPEGRILVKDLFLSFPTGTFTVIELIKNKKQPSNYGDIILNNYKNKVTIE